MAEDTVAMSEKMNPTIPVFSAILAGAFLYAYLPVLSGLVRAWAGSDDHSHGFAVIPIALYFLWQNRARLAAEPLAGAGSGLVLSALSLLCYVVARRAEMQTAVSLSMIFFIWGGTIYLCGYRVFRVSLFPLLLLFFMVPVPAQVIAALTIPLQLIVAKVSVALAALFGVPIYHEGNVIHLPGGSFEVVQACSGLRSIMALLTLGAVVSYLTLRSTALRAILFVLAVPIAILVNILRVFVLVTVFHYGHLDLSEGAAHTMLGLAVFLAALGLFVLCGRGLALCER
ncbi:exosortase [Geomonas sp. Red69]|uniref:exosortase n=1 Tax=Geomonas diazotrophica TaxID=2843197 RepID=UPI001C0F489C|nr:exosortase [Geomonas diazotrophica]MBU5638127.1 exosortase [Geomonas diazotrophica]